MYDEFYKRNLAISGLAVAVGLIIGVISVYLLFIGGKKTIILALAVSVLLISFGVFRFLGYRGKFNSLVKLFEGKGLQYALDHCHKSFLGKYYFTEEYLINLEKAEAIRYTDITEAVCKKIIHHRRNLIKTEYIMIIYTEKLSYRLDFLLGRNTMNEVADYLVKYVGNTVKIIDDI